MTDGVSTTTFGRLKRADSLLAPLCKLKLEIALAYELQQKLEPLRTALIPGNLVLQDIQKRLRAAKAELTEDEDDLRQAAIQAEFQAQADELAEMPVVVPDGARLSISLLERTGYKYSVEEIAILKELLVS